MIFIFTSGLVLTFWRYVVFTGDKLVFLVCTELILLKSEICIIPIKSSYHNAGRFFIYFCYEPPVSSHPFPYELRAAMRSCVTTGRTTPSLNSDVGYAVMMSGVAYFQSNKTLTKLCEPCMSSVTHFLFHGIQKCSMISEEAAVFTIT